MTARPALSAISSPTSCGLPRSGRSCRHRQSAAMAARRAQDPLTQAGLRWMTNNPTMRLQMINVQEFARRLSTLGGDAFTSDHVVDLATAADVRISADLEIDATLAQRLLDQISPTLPVNGVQIAASQWPPPTSSRPAAPSVSFSSPGAVDGPADQPARPRSSGPTRGGRRPGSRRTGR